MKNHNLSLPDWGSYNKVYTGISHVFDAEEGIRFDVDLFPGFYRHSVLCPRTVADCGAHAWNMSEDGTHFAFRYELERKDRVYVDAECTVSNDDCLMELSFVNQTEMPQSVQADLCFSLRYPTFLHEEFREWTVSFPEDVTWIRAVDYQTICCPEENAADGLRKGEMLGHGFVGKSGINPLYFGEEGTSLSYTVPRAAKQIGIRYRAEEDISLSLVSGSSGKDVVLRKSDGFSFVVFPLELQAGELTLLPHGGQLTLDGLAFSASDSLENVVFAEKKKRKKPKIQRTDSGMTLTFGEKNYVITWDYADYVIRHLNCSDPGSLLEKKIHDHVSSELHDGTEGYAADLFLRPVFLQPGETKKITVRIASGNENPVVKSEYFSFRCNPDGKPYLFSQNLTAAVTMTNLVFPVYCRGSWIKHSCPGRVWDSLYTWDSGMIGIGLSAVSSRRAEENLNAYLVEPDCPDCAFIMHGSTVPTQMFLFLELWQKTRDERFLRQYYPSMKRYYRFYSEKKKNAPFTGLLQTWNQFYNSGGWDDYPPQKYMHEHQLEEFVSPVISTAMTILFAKILLLFAPETDKKLYLEDIDFFSRALEYAWDEETGYYGYVYHDERNGTAELLRTSQGEQYNKGLDGLYPLLVGAVPNERKRKMLDHIERDLMTDIGLSVVDTTASYFRTDGYWNGSVWMPHQWIVSRALLDLGEHALSYRIADTALKVWKREADETYNCYEHFMIANGRGAGFHQFSGLSSPVMKWFETYYVPGTVTCGFQTKILQAEWREDGTSLHLELEVFSDKADVVVCMNAEKEYRVERAVRVTAGAYCLSFDRGRHTVQMIASEN